MDRTEMEKQVRATADLVDRYDRNHRTVSFSFGRPAVWLCGHPVAPSPSSPCPSIEVYYDDLMVEALIVVPVPYFLPLGLAMFILGIIPYIGPTLAAVLILGTTFAATGLTPGIVMTVVVILPIPGDGEQLPPAARPAPHDPDEPADHLPGVPLRRPLAGVLGALLALPVAGAVQILVQDKMTGKK
jgi:hypothetical protein